MSRRPSGSSNPRYSASPTAGGLPNGTWSGPVGRAVPPATPTSLTWPERCTTYAFGRAGGMTKSSSTWKTIDSSLGVRGVATSVSPPGMATDSEAGAASRKRTSVRAALGPSSRIPSSSSSATWSLSGTRLSR